MTVTVDVQWALYGRASATMGFRVLSCSKGKLNRGNFSEVIGRFSLGTLDVIPQVTVSYVPSVADEDNYMALAIHKFAEAGRDVRPGETGPLAVFTSYFCAPYTPLANAAVGYLPLYRALNLIKLPAQDGSPLPTMLTEAETAAASPTGSTLAKQVASLLLTGRPVCVLGASSIGLIDRLQFIDTVMAQLPYGYRARMTAATWVRPTHRDHRFRLYFSDAVRDQDPPDHVVWWDRPEQTDLTSAHGAAYEYQRFLDDEARQSAASLSEQTNPHGFKREDLREVFAGLGITESGPATEDDFELPEPQQPGQATVGADPDSCEAILEDCAKFAQAPSPALLGLSIGRLGLAASAGLSDAQRAKYREIIARLGLFRHNPLLGEHAAKLYDALLLLAFGKPLSYKNYCQVEDSLGDPPGTPPDKVLLQAIERCGMADAFVTAIVLTYLGAEQKLHMQFASSRFDGERLINRLARKWERPQHFRIVCDVTLDYLSVATNGLDPATAQRTLHQHGFLAQALLDSGSTGQYQVHALYRLLQAAYPKRLNRTAITAVLCNKPKRPVTPALFAAVLLRLANREDAQLARDAYAIASLTGLGLESGTMGRIRPFLPVLDQSSGRYFGTQANRPAAERGGTRDDVPGPGA